MARKRLFVIGACILLQSIVLGGPPGPGVKIPASVQKKWLELGIDSPVDPIRDPGKKGIVNSIENGYTLLLSGTINIPVVLMQYPDLPGTYSINDFQAMLFGSWTSGSANDFYKENSYGKLNISGTVAGWGTSAQPGIYYADKNNKTYELVVEAVQQADPYIDFSQYDRDADGLVDCFSVVNAGFGADEGGNRDLVWAHRWQLRYPLGAPLVTNDPDPNHPGEYMKIDNYTIQSERGVASNYNDMRPIGVFCHEWGHAFGLPDLYDTDGGSIGMGTWCLMGSGSWGGDMVSPWSPAHMSSWCKIDLGWLTPTIVSANNFYTVKSVEQNAQAFIVRTNGSPQKEYFLVENRQKIKFDQTLFNSGLLICHIDENVIEARRPNNQVNAGGASPYGVAVEQADGNDHLWNGSNSGDAGDVFPGSTNNTAFDNTGTNPDSRTNSGNNTNCGVNKIPASASSMSAYMYISSGGGGTETELKYDENTVFYVVSEEIDNAYAVQFTPTKYPYKVKKIGLYVSSYGNPTTPFDLFIIPEGGSSTGIPNVHATTPDAFNWFDVSSLNVIIESGDFYAGILYNTASNPKIGTDVAPPLHHRSWNYWEGDWYNFDEWDSPWSDSMDLMIRVKGSSTGVEETQKENHDVTLLTCQPNPFSQNTQIQFQVPVSDLVNLKIYDPSGRLIRTLVDGLKTTGTYKVTWDGKDETGNRIPQGVYFYHLTTPKSTLIQKVVLLR